MADTTKPAPAQSATVEAAWRAYVNACGNFVAAIGKPDATANLNRLDEAVISYGHAVAAAEKARANHWHTKALKLGESMRDRRDLFRVELSEALIAEKARADQKQERLAELVRAIEAYRGMCGCQLPTGLEIDLDAAIAAAGTEGPMPRPPWSCESDAEKELAAVRKHLEGIDFNVTAENANEARRIAKWLNDLRALVGLDNA